MADTNDDLKQPADQPSDEPSEDAAGLRKALRTERQQRKSLQAELATARTADDGDTRLADAQRRVVHAEVRAAATGRLADPADALRLLDLETFTADNGDVDTAAITAAIDQLVASKPYLAAKARTPHAPQGTRGTAGSPEVSGDDWLRGLHNR